MFKTRPERSTEPFLTGADRFLTGIDLAIVDSHWAYPLTLVHLSSNLVNVHHFVTTCAGVISHKGDFLPALLKPTTEGAWSVAYENINNA